MEKPHKHAGWIKVWADNPSLKFQFRNAGTEWADVLGQPHWHELHEYRIKTEPNHDIVLEWEVLMQKGVWFYTDNPNLRITFDGETGELKSAEVLKK